MRSRRRFEKRWRPYGGSDRRDQPARLDKRGPGYTNVLAPGLARRLASQQVTDLLALIRSYASITSMRNDVHGVATHPEDDLILATAISGKAGYLVTGDAQLQKLASYEGVEIVSPASFVLTLRSGRQ